MIDLQGEKEEKKVEVQWQRWGVGGKKPLI